VHRIAYWTAVAAVATMLAPTIGQAQITTFTSLAAWTSAVTLPGVDSYDDLEIDEGFYDSPLSRTAGTHSYELTAEFGFVPVGTAPDTWMSNFFVEDAMTFGGFSSGVRAIGGNFFNTLENGAVTSGGQLRLTLVSGSLSTSVVLENLTSTSFFGFTSVGAITSLTVGIVDPVAFVSPFATVNDLRLGGAPASSVPEPTGYALLATGAAGLLASVRRRRAH